MKVRALKKFEGLRDNERSLKEGKDIFPKENDIWETSEERAIFLKEHGVVEIVEEKIEIEEKPIEEVVIQVEKPRVAKINKKKRGK